MGVNGTSAKILIVSHQEAIRARVNMIAQPIHQISAATDAITALAAIKASPPELIVIDQSLDDGLALCRQIKKESNRQLIPILFISEENLSIADRLAVIDAGGDDLIFGADMETQFPNAALIALARGRNQQWLTTHQLHQHALESDNARWQEARLRDARFASQWAHDIRSPLSAILGALELLISEANSDEFTKETLFDIARGAIKSANQINNLAEDLLIVTKLAAGKYPTMKEPTQICYLVENAIAAKSDAAAAKRIKLSTIDKKDCAPPLLMLDATLMECAIINLLANAIKHTPSGGNVSIEITTTAETVMLTIIDSGGGIAPADLPDIFEIYWLCKSARSSLGLGLALVKLVVAEHGGAVNVQSELSRGSQFRITLPINST
jgi:signal transduction histidine kinase